MQQIAKGTAECGRQPALRQNHFLRQGLGRSCTSRVVLKEKKVFHYIAFPKKPACTHICSTMVAIGSWRLAVGG